jgi:flagellar basal-body rod protein FlgB
LTSKIQSISDKKHFQSDFEVKVDNDSPVVSDGNNVDVSREMADMAKNSIIFKFASKKMNGYYQGLQNVIRGGK